MLYFPELRSWRTIIPNQNLAKENLIRHDFFQKLIKIFGIQIFSFFYFISKELYVLIQEWFFFSRSVKK